MANPWMKEKCEICGLQIMSAKYLGDASFQSANHEEWKEEEAGEIHRNICNRCSVDIGYEG
jgi:hypothetical protein